jgi:hypothetical protein
VNPPGETGRFQLIDSLDFVKGYFFLLAGRPVPAFVFRDDCDFCRARRFVCSCRKTMMIKNTKVISSGTRIRPETTGTRTRLRSNFLAGALFHSACQLHGLDISSEIFIVQYVLSVVRSSSSFSVVIATKRSHIEIQIVKTLLRDLLDVNVFRKNPTSSMLNPSAL